MSSMCYVRSTSIQSLLCLKPNLTGKTCRTDICCGNENNAIVLWETDTSQFNSCLQAKLLDMKHRSLDFEKRAHKDSMHKDWQSWIRLINEHLLNSQLVCSLLQYFEFGVVLYRKRLDKRFKISLSPFNWQTSRSKIIPANNSVPRDFAS